MNEKILIQLFQRDKILQEQFIEETDELLYYDIKKEILYAYSYKNKEWIQSFVFTDCSKRWIELIHETDGAMVERFLTELRRGAKQAEMVCRFYEDNSYSWYYTFLKVVDCLKEDKKDTDLIAIGYRRNLLLGSSHEEAFFSNTMDYLTKVYKKQQFKKCVEENMRRYTNQKGALCVLDFNNFQIINEKFGYKTGDALLKDFVKVIQRNISTSDFVGRLSGDTFVIYMNNVTADVHWKESVHSILRQIRQTYQHNPMYAYVSVHAGVALYPKHGKNYDILLERAKEAWTYEKLMHTEGVEVYHEGMLRRKWDRRIIENTDQRSLWQDFKLYKDTCLVPGLTKDLFQSVGQIGSSVDVLLKRIGEHYQVSSVHIYELLKTNKRICCTYEWHKEERNSNIMHILGISDENVANKVMKAKVKGMAQIFEREEELFGLPKKDRSEMPHIANGMYVELIHKEYYLGRMILVDDSSSHIWTKEEMQELEWFGNLFAQMFCMGNRDDCPKFGYRNQENCDSLTLLYKGDAFLENLQKLITENKDKTYLLVYSDISNFKYVNETFGYDVGDSILRRWADILLEDIPSIVFGGRICYDHIVGVREIDKNLSESDILKCLKETKSIMEHKLRKEYQGSNITINTGAFCIREDVPDMSAALAYANMARKLSKHGGMRCVLYTDAMRKVANKEMELVACLEDAIRNREFVVYLQPKVGCKNDKVVGAEALVRWMKNGELIYPDAFIGVFEKYGCVVDLDYYVYEEMFRFVRNRIDEGKPLIPISLNVSRAHMVNTDLIDKIESLLEKYKIPTNSIEFEITESLYLEDLPGLDRVLAYFRERGFAISMDDFGTGYSSLNAISTLPIDVIKMDKIFMKRNGLGKNDKIIITHIISMANELEKKVLCEGVETDEQKQFIGAVGCDSWQGYLFSKPVTIPEFEKIVSGKEE
ncbi:MAG: EAL domain-containing protein [Lachnospiraceae bacterium]|nr:EAL domain-containing protein [Lachnospiraceae bacterium]